LASASRDLFAYERSTADETIIVAVNFGATRTSFRVRTGRRWTVIFGSHERATSELSGGEQLILGSREAIILLAG
jgi:Alpha amylase, C-terminal all-beta domain.